MIGTDEVWEKLGETDAYYGVLSRDRFRASNLDPDALRSFFELGEQDVDIILRGYDKYFGPVHYGSALDFGCGVGRLVLPLARRFERATGVDISPSMLAKARANAGELGMSNVEFVLSDDRLTRAVGVYDFVNTFIVLQHIPIDRGLVIIQALLDRVAPGGGCSLHMSVARRASFARRVAYRLRFSNPVAGGLINVAKGLPWSNPAMQMNEYPLAKVFAIFERAGFAGSSPRSATQKRRW